MTLSISSLDAFASPAWLTDPASRTVLDTNQAALDLFGQTRESFLNLSPADLASGRGSAGRKSRKALDIRTQSLEVDRDGLPAVPVLANLDEKAGSASRRCSKPAPATGTDALHELLFNSLPTRAIVLTPNDHKVVAATDIFASDMNFPREAFLGRSVFELVDAASTEQHKTLWAGLRRALQRVTETKEKFASPFLGFPTLKEVNPRSKLPDRFLAPTTWPVLGPDGNLAFIVHTVDDVTRLVTRRAAEDKIAPEDIPKFLEDREFGLEPDFYSERGSHLRIAKRLLGLGIWRVDLDTLRLERSANISTILGIPDDLITERFSDYLDMIHPDDSANVRAQARRFVESKENTFRFDYRIVRPDGSILHILTAGELSITPSRRIVTGVVRDITGRVRDQVRKARDEARFRLVTEATSDLIWDEDFETGEVWWNTNFSRVLGHSPEEAEAPNTFWNDQVHPDDKEKLQRGRREFLDGDGDTFVQTYRMQTKSGAVKWVNERARILRDNNGRPLRMVSGITDITEQIELENRLRQTERLEAIGRLTGGFAHDFNNLLTIILGNAETLTDRLPEGPLREMAQLTLSASESGAELIHRLLSFSRLQPLVPKLVSLNSLALETQALVWRALPENVSIEVKPADDLWSCRIDGPQFQAALVNLCVNARDAMPAGGRILIETENALLTGTEGDLHAGASPGEFVVLSVTDNGIGMSPETIARVFEPFFTTKPPGVGSGLGLSMVYGFVQQSGGSVRIYSELNVGTRVSLYFPRAAQAELPSPKISSGAETTFPMLHVLIVEDNERVRNYVCRLVQELGMTVTEASNSIEALARLESESDIDLLFTDIVLPGSLNGADLAAAAKARWPHLKILFTSGYTRNAIMQRGGIDGGIPILSKPYRREDLEAKLWEVLNTPAVPEA